MIVHRPAAVGDLVAENPRGKQIVFIQHVIADIAAAFPLAAEETHPVERPVVAVELPAVFDVIPHAVRQRQQFGFDLLGVPRNVLLAAEFHPPEIIRPENAAAVRIHTVAEFFLRQFSGERRGREGHFFRGFPYLYQARTPIVHPSAAATPSFSP